MRTDKDSPLGHYLALGVIFWIFKALNQAEPREPRLVLPPQQQWRTLPLSNTIH